jgi:hypothetical protein
MDAWMHGDLAPEINRTWLGIAGPGVRHLGRTSVWASHADIRPTIMLVTGLRDDYTSEGRPLFELLTDRALPASLRSERDDLLRLAQVFEQIDAPVGALNLDGVRASTRAIASGSAANDARYAAVERAIGDLTARRDAVAARITAVLTGAAFGHRSAGEHEVAALADQGRDLLAQAADLAGSED